MQRDDCIERNQHIQYQVILAGYISEKVFEHDDTWWDREREKEQINNDRDDVWMFNIH